MISERGRKIREANYKRYGRDYYKELGRKGGKAKHRFKTGFAQMDREKVVEAGRKGGTNSRRSRED